MKKILFQCLLGIVGVAQFTACQKDGLNPATDSRNNLSDASALVVQPGLPASANSTTLAGASKYNTFYGPAVQMGDGHARSWINITHEGNVLGIGVEMTNEALNNLPTDHLLHPEYILTLHPKAKALTAFDHIALNWNIEGHEPPGIYTLPHFDFHFYTMPLADRLAIPPYEVSPAGFDNLPTDGYQPPPPYFQIPGGVPAMGSHWVDPTSPEFQPGNIFTHTFIYGSYAGKLSFFEPMITHATLTSGQHIEKAIPQTEKVSPEGRYYPQQYSIWQNETTHRHYVALDEMRMR